MIESTPQRELDCETSSLPSSRQYGTSDASSVDVRRPVVADGKLRKSISHEAGLLRDTSIEVSVARPALRKRLPLEEREEQARESDSVNSAGEKNRQYAFKGVLMEKRGAFGSSDPVRATHETVPLTPLSALLGKDMADDLEARFASAQPPFSGPTSHKGVHTWERDGDGKVRVTPDRTTIRALLSETTLHDTRLQIEDGAMDVQALISGTCYLWVVTLLGRLIVGQEMPALPPVMLVPKDGATEPREACIGHPALTGGGAARIAGDLRYDRSNRHIVVSNTSGRYSRYSDRRHEHLLNVVQVFASYFAPFGIPVVQNPVQKKVKGTLVYPSSFAIDSIHLADEEHSAPMPDFDIR